MLRVQTTWTGVGLGTGYTNLHFAGVGQPAAQEAVDRVQAFWSACSNRLANSVLATISAEVLEIDPANGEVEAVHITESDAVPGFISGQRVPDAAQVLIRLRTASFRGARRILGRFNIPGLAQNQIVNGALDSGAVAFFNDAIDDQLLSGPNTSELVVWSRPRGPLFVNGVQADVISGTTWEELAVLGSRRT